MRPQLAERRFKMHTPNIVEVHVDAFGGHCFEGRGQGRHIGARFVVDGMVVAKLGSDQGTLVGTATRTNHLKMTPMS